jgi:hypothetical protein
MSIAATAEGTLHGRIALLSIKDAKPSLAYKLHIPVRLEGEEATLSVDLRHPEVRSWRGLTGRCYLFNESTKRYGKSDGETYALDDVFGDLRTQTGWYDTLITGVQFGGEANGRLDVEVRGTIRLPEERIPFTVSAKVKVEGVMLEEEFKDAAAELLDLEDYQPLQMIDGVGKYEPRL